MNKFFHIVFITIVAAGCSDTDRKGLKFVDKGRDVPSFSADSAYQFIQDQVNFGSRVPNSEAHKSALSFYEDKFTAYAGNRSVFIQRFTEEGYDETLQLANVIVAFNPTSADRIMISAHWDSRPRADQDTSNINTPILGADDGGSGVAVLLELARIMKDNPPPIGVDIVLFDGEDYGTSGDSDKYFLGSRYWSENPPVPGYSPRFGILLDMVGGEGAQFPKEEYSTYFAPNLLRELWSIADEKGFDHIFLDEDGAAVSDDHVVVNRYTGIPIIDIINHTKNENGMAEFPPYWHTHQDNMEIISKETLQAVGDVLVELIYNRI